MKETDDIAVIVQARLGSERVPQKMIRPFAGTTLLDICLDKILECSSFPTENFFLAVHEDKLKEIGRARNMNVFERSLHSANSEGTSLSTLYEWWNKIPFKYAILVSACSPFLSAETIDQFFHAYQKTPANGLFGVISKNNYFWNSEQQLITPWPDGFGSMNTKYVDTTYEAAHCLYAGQLAAIGEEIWMGDFLTPGDIELFPMKEEEVIDVDYEWQFKLCEALYHDTHTFQ